MDNDKMVEVEAIRIFGFLLKIEFYIDLDETFIVPSFRQILISISTLNKYDFSCSFGNGKFNLFHNSKLVNSDTLSSYNNLYLIDMIASFNESL